MLNINCKKDKIYLFDLLFLWFYISAFNAFDNEHHEHRRFVFNIQFGGCDKCMFWAYDCVAVVDQQIYKVGQKSLVVYHSCFVATDWGCVVCVNAKHVYFDWLQCLHRP